jgi:hypothetical protein
VRQRTTIACCPSDVGKIFIASESEGTEFEFAIASHCVRLGGIGAGVDLLSLHDLNFQMRCDERSSCLTNVSPLFNRQITLTGLQNHHTGLR